MALTLGDYIEQFNTRVSFFGSATDALRQVLNGVRQQHSTTKKPNILLPTWAPPVLHRLAANLGFDVRLYQIPRRRRSNAEDPAKLVDEGTLALIMVHQFGIPENVEKLSRIATEAGIMLIEDCALTIHSTYHGSRVGTFGDCSVFSLRKTLMLPAGGFLVMNNHMEEADRSRHGFLGLSRDSSHNGGGPLRLLKPPIKSKWLREADGFPRAALSYIKLIDIDRIAAARRENYRYMAKRVRALPHIRPLHAELPEGCTPYTFPVLVGSRVRDSVQSWLSRPRKAGENGGVPTMFRMGSRSNGNQELLELPIHQLMTRSRLDGLLHLLMADGGHFAPEYESMTGTHS